jgi:hypothetical protein
MKRYSLILISLVLISLSACDKGVFDNPDDERIPRVAFLTTGAETGLGELPTGVLIAQRYFVSQGAIFSIRNRDLLSDPAAMSGYDLIIISTAAGYHDADRGYSLSFMSETEMYNLGSWVEQGGCLLAGDNVGRNSIRGVDRITEAGKLSAVNWPLAGVFGVEMEERNMSGYRIEGDSAFFGGLIMKASAQDEWVLVPTLLDGFKGEVKAWWRNDSLQVPAIVWNKYGKGQALLLPSSYLLHPANRGGIRSISQIETFYQEILRTLPGYNPQIRLNPWPGAYRTAFAVSLTAEGDSLTFERFYSFLNSKKIPLTMHVHPGLRADSMAALAGGDIEFAAAGLASTDFNELNYPKSVQELVQNKSPEYRFHGFRFPERRQSYWGLLALDNLGYRYDVSLPSEQLNQVIGGIHPYHLPVSSRGYYAVLNLLEMNPMLLDDAHYFSEISSGNPLEAEKQSLLFEAYLKRLHLEVMIPYRGLMVYSGSVGYTFQNDTTSIPLMNMIDSLRKEEGTWISHLSSVAARWSALEDMQVFAKYKKDRATFSFHLPAGLVIDELSFECDRKPESARVSYGKAQIISLNGKHYVILDARNEQKLEIIW